MDGLAKMCGEGMLGHAMYDSLKAAFVGVGVGAAFGWNAVRAETRIDQACGAVVGAATLGGTIAGLTAIRRIVALRRAMSRLDQLFTRISGLPEAKVPAEVARITSSIQQEFSRLRPRRGTIRVEWLLSVNANPLETLLLAPNDDFLACHRPGTFQSLLLGRPNGRSSLSLGVGYEAWAKGKTIRDNHARNSAHYSTCIDTDLEAPNEAIIASALLAGTERPGVLCITCTQAGAFSLEDEWFAAWIARRLAALTSRAHRVLSTMIPELPSTQDRQRHSHV